MLGLTTLLGRPGTTLRRAVRVVLGGFLGRFGRRFGRLLPVLHHGVSGNVLHPLLRGRNPAIGDVASADGAVQQHVSAHIQRVPPAVFVLVDGHDGGLPRHANLVEGIGVFEPARQGIYVAGGVHQLHMAHHFHILGHAVIVQAVRPGFLVRREDVHLPAEKVQFLFPVVPAVVGA